jgi:hypothetical protein
MLQCRVAAAATITLKTVSGFTNANPAKVTATAHGYSTGDTVTFPNAGIILSAFNPASITANLNQQTNGIQVAQTYVTTVIDANNFTLNGVDSTSFGTYISGGVVMKPMRFAAGSLPLKRVFYANFVNLYDKEFLSIIPGAGPILLTYDSDIDCLLYTSPAPIDSVGPILGTPYEVILQLVKECNSGAGPQPWINLPHGMDINYAQQFARVVKSSFLDVTTPNVCVEVSNEVWDTAGGFGQTSYADAKGQILFGVLDDGFAPTKGIDLWYGWKHYNTMSALQGILGSQFNRINRIFGVWTTDNSTTSATNRLTAPGTGVAATPASIATEIAPASYFEINRASQPQPVTIYNFKQGVLTNTPSLIASAYADLDAALLAPYYTITGKITDDTGVSGTTGTLLTVASLDSGGPLAANIAVNGFGVFIGFQTIIVSQLSGTTGGAGTYRLNIASSCVTGSHFTGQIWTNVGTLHALWWPFWFGQAATYGLKVCQYEGGWGIIPGFDNGGASASSQGGNNAPLTYSGGSTYNPLSAQDQFSLLCNYQNSSNYAAVLQSALNDFKAFGGIFPSQYTLTSSFPSNFGQFVMTYPSIFAPAPPSQATFLNFNAS